jgi:hypothetical protein
MTFVVENTLSSDCILTFNIEIKKEDATSVTCFGNEFQNKDIVIPAQTKTTIKMDFDEVLFKRGIYYVSPYFLIKYNSRTVIKDKYLEFAKKITVQEPSPLYLSNPERIWRSFPTRVQHGNISMEINRFCINSEEI